MGLARGRAARWPDPPSKFILPPGPPVNNQYYEYPGISPTPDPGWRGDQYQGRPNYEGYRGGVPDERLQQISDTAMGLRGGMPGTGYGSSIRSRATGASMGGPRPVDLLRKLLQQRGMALGG